MRLMTDLKLFNLLLFIMSCVWKLCCKVKWFVKKIVLPILLLLVTLWALVKALTFFGVETEWVQQFDVLNTSGVDLIEENSLKVQEAIKNTVFGTGREEIESVNAEIDEIVEEKILDEIVLPLALPETWATS